MSERRWGLDDSEWEAAVNRLTQLLVAAARGRTTITYGEAARHALDDRFSARSGALMDLLAHVDRREQASRGVMIATLVVRADTGRPGEGYFAFAEELLGEDSADRERFWLQHAQAVWDAYAEERSGK